MDTHNKGLRLRIQSKTNETLYAYVDRSPLNSYDDLGALYYVVAVVLIYGLSIVMMIASHMRKNQQDGQLRTCLKEMAILRKNDRRDKLIGVIVKTAPLNLPKKSVTVTLPSDERSASTPTSHITEGETSESLLPSDTESMLTYDSIPPTPKHLPPTPKHIPPTPKHTTATPSVKIQITDENGLI